MVWVVRADHEHLLAQSLGALGIELESLAQDATEPRRNQIADRGGCAFKFHRTYLS